jgi:Mce-associated membrane protein
MSASPQRPGWYPDPLRPDSQERRWDGTEWTDETREASVRDVQVPVAPAPRPEDLVEANEPDDEPHEQPDGPPGDESGDRPAGRATVALVAAIVVLVGVLILQVLYLWGPFRDDPTISSDRPVLLDEAATRSAVDTAARAAEAFSARSYQTYDEQVDAAARMMTTAYAEQFRETTDEIREEFIARETEVQVTVEAQAVMSASENQVEALVFLTQYTTKKDETTAFTPYRIKVTVIDTEQGWLVSAVDTQ